MPTAAEIKAQKEAERIARLNKYQADIEKMYNNVIDSAAQAAAGVTLKDGIFTLNKYTSLNNAINNELKKLTTSVDTYLHAKIETEYNQADIDNDSLFTIILNPENKASALINYRNEPAFNAFMERVDSTDGLNLSKKVFNYVGDYKQELEVGLGDGIAAGRSARAIAADLKQYLNEPDMLFRRVRKDGVLKLSKPALDYNPGQGVYRSSHKNVMRLTSSQTNISYRTADNTRYNNSPFVLGFEVKTSGQHPKLDICDELAGEYPKEFLFVGWHPLCICYNIPILLTPAQYNKMENDLLAGKDVSKINYSGKPAPTGNQAREWYNANIKRIENWSSKPFFLTDNADFFKD